MRTLLWLKISGAMLIIVIMPFRSFACELCKQNQPKPLQNITHGTGPQSDWDYLIITVGIIIVSMTLFYSIKLLVKPREDKPEHIKNIVVTTINKRESLT
ncbi:MAG: hypothetical protein ABJN36_10755 [Cyclobacteriaceae bacterium]